VLYDLGRIRRIFQKDLNIYLYAFRHCPRNCIPPPPPPLSLSRRSGAGRNQRDIYPARSTAIIIRYTGGNLTRTALAAHRGNGRLEICLLGAGVNAAIEYGMVAEKAISAALVTLGVSGVEAGFGVAMIPIVASKSVRTIKASPP